MNKERDLFTTENSLENEELSGKKQLRKCVVAASVALAASIAICHFSSRRVSDVDYIQDTEITSLSESPIITPQTESRKEEQGLFVSPTLRINTQDEVTKIPAQPESTPVLTGEVEETEAPCVFRAAFSEDVTIPDGTLLDPSTRFTKTWEVINIGNCPWPESTRLSRLSNEIDGDEETLVGEVMPGEVDQISVNLVSPDQDGDYIDYWQLKTDKANIDGGRLTVVIRIGRGEVIISQQLSPNFELGTHIYDTDIPHADLVKESGMNWIKTQMHYGQDPESVVERAHKMGFKVLIGALGSPDMVGESDFEQKFCNWVRTLSEAGVDGIEIWNEPNISREWNWNYLGGKNYASLLKVCSEFVQSGKNPDSLIISAALANSGCWGEMGCGCTDFCGCGCNDDEFLRQMVESGAGKYVDLVGVHFNSGATSLIATSGHPAGEHFSWYFVPTINNYFNAFEGQKNLAVTEMGIVTPQGTCPSKLPSNFSWANGNSVEEQAMWLSQGVEWAKKSGKVQLAIIWNLDFQRNDCGPNPGDPQQSYAIIRPDGSCPACLSLKQVMGE